MTEPKKYIPVQHVIGQPGIGFSDAGGACSEAEPFALRVLGDSMEPEFMEGHIIMVDPSMPPVDGSYVMAEYEDSYIFRQLAIVDGKKLLKPLNDNYPVIELQNNQAIVGVITQRAGKRRRETKHYI
jgi:phage repressor protein C with HTH and peptisase S24 domain